MNTENQGLSLKVGIFVLSGLLMTAGLVMFFGRFGDSIKPRYQVTVEFPNASGLLKNSKVLMFGAYIGNVVSSPHVLSDRSGISVKLKIDNNVQIPKNAMVVVGSSGLLGDRFVDVIPKEDNSTEYYKPGDIIKGNRLAGIDEVAKEGGLLLTDLRKGVGNLNDIIQRLDKDVLDPKTLDQFKGSVSNLESMTENFRQSSAQIDSLMTDARSTVTEVREAVGSVKGTFDSAQAAANNLEPALTDFKKTMSSVRQVVTKATTGDGLIAELLTDKTLANNLDSLIENLRKSGFIFYKDRSADDAQSADASRRRRATTPSRRR